MAHRNVLDSFRLDGKVALVTGGGRGLGRTMALALAEAGADVAIAGRTLATVEATAEELSKETGRRVQAFQADVSRQDDVTRLTAEVTAAMSAIDILVNNAGNNIRGPVQELTEADWDTVLNTNLKGPFLCAQAIGPAMAKRGWGRIINLGSILSVIAIPGRAPYASAKAGLTSLTRVLALEWAGTGVTVNAICPGPFGTEMNRALLDDPVKYAEFVRNIPLGRWGEVDELAGVAVLLASDASSFITGSSVFIDGGWTAR
jgi:NAD(P)-dependent dehydrogenase (short-subunit alcohol dehydrogenase family)